MKKIKVIIDPGHGGSDRANVGPTGYVEADGVLELSKRVAAKLTATGFFEVKLTRETDMTLSLIDRVNIGKNFQADMLVSNHTNAFHLPTAGGAVVFYSVHRPQNEKLAARISADIAKEFNVKDRKAQVRKNDAGNDYYGMTRYSVSAGIKDVLLVESLFHSNPIEEAILKSVEGLEKLATIQARAICEYYGFSYKEGNMEKTLEEKVDLLWKKVFGEESEESVNNATKYPVVSYGQVSKDVGELQKLLIKHGAKITADNSFGPATKKAVEDFQRANGLVVGSPVGDKMWGMLYAEPKKETAPPSPSRPTLNYLDKNENVKLLQALLNKDGFALTVDGSFGPGTLAAVNSFQKRYSLPIKNMVDLTMWQKLEEVTSGKKSIYSKIRRFSSDVHVLELPQEDYFVDLEHGELSKMERPSTIANNLRKQSRDVIAAVNYGFFGGNQEQLGSWLDEGSYKKIPHPDFIDVIYHKNGKLEVKNFTGHDAAQINPLKTSAHWMGGLSYSLIQDGKINLELSGLYSHSRSRQPRTLIGQKANGVFVIVVVDGRSDTSLGVTAQQSAEIMLELGCVEAANADGGGSSALSIFDGNSVKVVSKPSEKVERAVGTCLMIYRK